VDAGVVISASHNPVEFNGIKFFDGSGYKLAKQLGHNLIPTVPALVQLKCSEDYFKAVSGVRADGNSLSENPIDCLEVIQ